MTFALLSDGKDSPWCADRDAGPQLPGMAGHLPCILGIVSLILVAFGRSLWHGFVWDDTGLIVDNPFIKSLAGIRQVLGQSFWATGPNVEDPTRSFYRPLISLSFALDYALWGLRPFWFHLTNLIAHVAAAVSAYFLAFVLLRRRPAALAAGALFAVHPTHVENVCWISGRTDVFCGVFYFLSLTGFLLMCERRRHRPVMAAVTVGAYVAALLSKETAITLPLVAVAAMATIGDGDRRWREAGSVFGVLILVSAGYLFLRARVLGAVVAPAVWGTLWQRVASVPMVFAAYMGSLFTLISVDPHHSTRLVSEPTDVRFVVGLVVSVCYVFLLIPVFRMRLKNTAFLLAWIPLTLAPTFKLGSFGDVAHADRFLYVPSFGFAVLLVDSVLRLNGVGVLGRAVRIPGWVVTAAFTVVVVCWTGLTVSYSMIWRDNLSLFSHAAVTSPSSAYVLGNLGTSYAARGEHMKALTAYTRAAEIDPNDGAVYVNMGMTHMAMGLYAEAQRCYLRGIELGHRCPMVFSKMAESWRAQGDPAMAISWYLKSLAAGATVSAHNNIGECLLAIGSPDEAESHFLAALDMDPQPATCNNLASVAIQRKEYGVAADLLERALLLAGSQGLPPDVEIAIYYNFARCSLGAGDRRAASEYARKVLAMAETLGPLFVRYGQDTWLLDLAQGP